MINTNDLFNTGIKEINELNRFFVVVLLFFFSTKNVSLIVTQFMEQNVFVLDYPRTLCRVTRCPWNLKG